MLLTDAPNRHRIFAMQKETQVFMYSLVLFFYVLIVAEINIVDQGIPFIKLLKKERERGGGGVWGLGGGYLCVYITFFEIT